MCVCACMYTRKIKMFRFSMNCDRVSRSNVKAYDTILYWRFVTDFKITIVLVSERETRRTEIGIGIMRASRHEGQYERVIYELLDIVGTYCIISIDVMYNVGNVFLISITSAKNSINFMVYRYIIIPTRQKRVFTVNIHITSQSTPIPKPITSCLSKN